MSDPNILRERAERGDVLAQVALGLLYSDGKGVSQDDVEAAKWYGRAARQGDVDAQTALGVAYAGGLEFRRI